MSKTVLYLYLESPLHVGTGSGLGAIDLPIQREQHTDLPLVQGSGVKGALRALATDNRPREDPSTHQDKLIAVFGPEPGEHASEHAGAVMVSDARLLLFPVRSLHGVFAWATAPLILKRFWRDMDFVGKTPTWNIPALPMAEQNSTPVAYVPDEATSGIMVGDSSIVLEEYTFTAQREPWVTEVTTWLSTQWSGLDSWWMERIKKHLVVLPDTAMRDFALYSTEVVTRVRIDAASKTVQNGALWTEECLPTDAILYSLVMARPPATKKKNGITTDTEVLDFVHKQSQEVFQLGGDITIGRGLVRPVWGSVNGSDKEVIDE